MRRKAVTTIIALIVLFGIYFLFSNDNNIEDNNEATIDNQELVLKPSIREIVQDFIGASYVLGPLGEKEGEKIYRDDVFDCTTLVLTVAAIRNAQNKSPAEIMKKINYYPQGEVSYETRLHFSTYRNKVSQYFEDITEEVGGDYTQQKTVLLNKVMDNGKRLLDIDWKEEITINYILTKDVPYIMHNLPLEVGVGLVPYNLENIGLDITHEGFVIDNKNFIHASSKKGKVVVEDFLDYLKNNNHEGVLFYILK